MVSPLGAQGQCWGPGPAWPPCFHTAGSGVPSSPFAGGGRLIIIPVFTNGSAAKNPLGMQEMQVQPPGSGTGGGSGNPLQYS